MYICPLCAIEFNNEEDVVKHYLSCWKAKYPNHKSKPAPHSEDKEVKYVSKDVLNFFSQMKGE